MKKEYHLLLLFLTAATIASAQSSFAIQYSINFPMGTTSDYIEKTSFAGATADYRYKVMPALHVGVSIGWYSFYEEKAYDSYTTQNESMTLSGKQFRYVNSVPILVTADYVFSEEKISPFAGLGIGTTYNSHNTEMGLYEIQVDSWHFTLAPEAGVRIGINESVAGYVSARYNYSLETSALDAQSYLTLNIGVSFGF
jgi:hypothetical protein